MNGRGLLDQMNVSRETISRLERFEEILLKWNPKINLVSKASLENLWHRHIVDSVQVFTSVKDPGDSWVDIGSGGGFPGIVVAIMAAEYFPKTKVTLIESDQRKSAFLRTAARECGVPVTVLSQRIEQATPQNAHILSARALAELDTLLEFSEQHLAKDGLAVFPKGANWKKEVDKAAERWSFDVEPITSLTETEAVILKIKGVVRV
ncbi:16S rRNA (guanine(527)-N(7))-methyltransferase RsmG [Phaeobacter sp. 11ANDIMAR09]|uniref:16S rRNA (guanine(527)-N(7))-methyltransferase RsmG n=1 Tax=Phaeobacter sp. 11ANDIMAR09 TaxID=1225647 RepID=UPI0006C8401B|nr:16S rRNA (guanine(527)-N(7))-methyltransferase RsmG [Phaeobacter sp. 11ANDIMAR09]KPD14376.1 16S rRNA methyltransferase [Phaeobacter sp. 11ANDIMAR09]